MTGAWARGACPTCSSCPAPSCACWHARFVLDDFARSFALADKVLLPQIYFVRDSETERKNVSADDLAAQIRAHAGDAEFLDGFDTIVQHLLAHVGPGDLVIVMGAGDVWKIADEYLRRLREGR